MKIFRRLLIAFTLVAVVSPGAALANHKWGCYKFATTNVNWSNEAPGDYGAAFYDEMWGDGDSWNNSTVVNILPVGSSQPNTILSRIVYHPPPDTHKGITYALPGPDGCTLDYMISNLNTFYLDSASQAVRKHVACHELGHSVSLDERSEGNSCMNTTITSAPYPDGHDTQTVGCIYTGAGCGGGGGGGCNHNLQCYPSLNKCLNSCCGVCERRINCGGATAHKCFE